MRKVTRELSLFPALDSFKTTQLELTSREVAVLSRAVEILERMRDFVEPEGELDQEFGLGESVLREIVENPSIRID